MTKELNEKIKEIEKKFPEISPVIKSVRSHESSNGTPFIEDIKYLETDKYKVIGIKFEKHSWSGSSGIQWDEWVSAYFNEKGRKGIREYNTSTITTRDRYSAKNDRRDLWPYNHVSLEKISESEFEIAWMNHDGDKRFNKQIRLD